MGEVISGQGSAACSARKKILQACPGYKAPSR